MADDIEVILQESKHGASGQVELSLRISAEQLVGKFWSKRRAQAHDVGCVISQEFSRRGGFIWGTTLA